MRNSWRPLLLAATTVIGLAGGPLARANEAPLNFGIISTEASQNQERLWKPFLADMSKALGREVKPFYATDYAGVIQAMRFNKVDIAWYGNKAAMEAVDRADGQVFAQTVAANGDPGYWSLLLVNKQSPYQTLDALLADAGKLTFGNGDPNSTSGYLVPGYYVFAQRNLDPNKIFKRTLNANHEANALSVANGLVDVATCNTESLERLQITQPEKAAKLRILWKSPLIPSDPLVWRKALPQDLKQKVQDFLFSYGRDAHEKEVLKNLQWSRLQASDDDQLLPIRQLALYQQRGKVEGDGSLSAADKARQLEEIDQRLKAIGERMETLGKSAPQAAQAG
ncbi:phosphonate ABC transporter substrate-binding protein [Pseudomonas schmalbachii]|uniref:Phosphonate ABC transporter substrate-binding protein n=1 Tax=Pseudomonas schmalbachii TaxID=2816993 RepID=A0ABS3TQ73_9PSED|nr:phosphonate ABC transporter substrate-binding protein [Pseudomonas schmalbachii]MBO3275807.1 phosphonate ABC transporter substrate-binding protein [Pseudomonas schmalbachii]